MHKTGSTTISNILFRLGLSNNSTIAVFTKHTQGLMKPKQSAGILGPLLGSNYVNPHPQDIDVLTGDVSTERSAFDIQLEHTHFKEKDVFKIMTEDTKFIATVRHPFNHLKSVFNHYHMWKDLGMDPKDEPNAVQLFLQHPYKYENNSKMFRVRNKMVYEFGIDMKRLGDEAYVENYLDHLAERFDLVLITEYLDESLILLKRRMCWEMKDIIYLAQRNATYSGKYSKPEDYGELLETHKQWTWVDYKLYYKFLRYHNETVLSLGREFQEEVDVFRAILQIVHQYCNDFQQKVWDKERYEDNTIAKLSLEVITVQQSQFNKAFSVSGVDCLKMRFSHTTMRHIVISKQYPQSCSSTGVYPIMANPLYCKSHNSETTFFEQIIPLYVARRTHGYLA